MEVIALVGLNYISDPSGFMLRNLAGVPKLLYLAGCCINGENGVTVI